MSWVLLVLIVVVVLWGISAYNGLIALKNQTINAFKQIDVQLKRRHDLIPNLVSAVKGAMDFERDTLEAVIKARNQAIAVPHSGPENMKQIGAAEAALGGALSRLMVVVEQYPQLKATGNVGQLQEELTSTENKIAFATGRDPQHAHIAVTEGLVAKLNRDELQAVVAHELGHIKNYDVRLMTTLAALVGAVLLIQDGVWRSLRFGPRGGGGRGGKKDSAGPLVIALLALWIVSWLLAPVITQVLALGVSRKREYLADAMAAQFTRNPLALASALEKIEHSHEPTKAIRRGAAHLCIADPLGRRLTNREGFLADAFATHPPMAMRISRLKGMGYAQLKRESGQTG